MEEENNIENKDGNSAKDIKPISPSQSDIKNSEEGVESGWEFKSIIYMP